MNISSRDVLSKDGRRVVISGAEIDRYQEELAREQKKIAKIMWEDEPVNGDLYSLYDKEGSMITEEQIHALADRYGRRTK